MLDVKANFSSLYPNETQCELCNSGYSQTQRHLLENCEKITANSKSIYNNVSIDHDFIYEQIDQQIEVIKLYIEIQNVRERLEGQ